MNPNKIKQLAEKMTPHTNMNGPTQSHVPQLGPCWQWTRKTNCYGYGVISVMGKKITAHRASWMIMNGEIPKGLCVLHRCDNRSCVNPSHLMLGTHRDNVFDRVKKGRTRVPVGEKNGSSKLVESDVLEIRKRYLAGGISMRRLAKSFGVCHTVIRKIVNGEKWKYLLIRAAVVSFACRVWNIPE